ncbi:DUF3015 family protein [Silvanigrella aquatica]|uniref:Orotate phosphoribosyltransferase n=1 Tax=Silvanigrella aquatica TaxID=1915309 RepID=A0A1L4D1D3_9BACT|nr:DUF3015 family protein [Silvanigrella aquatica]APJ04012.1 hypothetical protein AXG55_08870 [Silvanigrella aquatica]
MKKILSKKNVLLGTAALSMWFSQSSFAVGSAGCGLGSIIFSEEVWWKQVFAATSNGSSGTQTFGITSGTSNCAPGLFSQRQKQKDFVAANLSSLEREAAQGNGETVKGLASVMGCNGSTYHNFGAHVQANYNAIFNSNDPAVVVTNIHNELQKNEGLSQSCKVSS